MKHSILDQHKVIAWDIDETLVDGPNSARFCAYICAHPEKTHHLITFRDPHWAATVYDELEGIVPRELIASVNPLSHEVWAKAQGFLDESNPDVIAHRHFKGSKAKELGCTILVDDMALLVEEGCLENDVAFLDAHHPWSMDAVEVSKFLSYVLRHQPDAIGVEMDEAGWVDLADLVRRSHAIGQAFDEDDVRAVVASSDKKRFSLSEDGTRIRAAQGHSIKVSTAPEAAPPSQLFHGTAIRFLDSIRQHGLKPGDRRHVHLSDDRHVAWDVGTRHGRPVVLKLDVAGMIAAGLKFYLADNGVWLTDTVPPQFLSEF